MNNLQIAFPEKTPQERISIAKQFYKNLSDSFFETVKMFSITKNEFLKRCSGNFDEINEVVKSKKNIHIMACHQFSWEYSSWMYSLLLQIPVAGIYIPVNNKVMDKLLIKLRQRFGLVLIDATKYGKEILSISRGQHALALIADQNPASPARSYWLNFFNKPAPFFSSQDKSARRNNNAVVFANIKKIKRGYYYFENTIISRNAAELQPGELTVKFRDFIEAGIRADPANYLWSHRRWKNEYKKEYEKQWID
jgi:KDO2-lipid IV(A) lauroyltransferase